jgi:hypothetical protein
MKTIWMLTTVVAMSVTAAVGAQSAKAVDKPSKDGTMSMTYTGCVESVNHDGSFVLTKVDGHGDSMDGDMAMTHHDAMAMKDDPVRTMQNGETPNAGDKMAEDEMHATPSKSFALAGSANLSKHVGQKVSVTGSLSNSSTQAMRHNVSTLTVKTLKVIATSCS